MATGYTDEANKFVDELISKGIAKEDVVTHYVKGGKVVIYPVIGKDRKPHLKKEIFK